MRNRVQFDILLLLHNAPGANDYRRYWQVTAEASVETYRGSWNEPAETVVEDIEITGLIDSWEEFGLTTGMFTASMTGEAIAATLEWLNSVVDDHDRWADEIRAKAVRVSQERTADV